MAVEICGGPGTNRDNAYVISVENARIDFLRAQYGLVDATLGNGWRWDGQTILHDDGRTFDVLSVQTDEGAREFWFDITQPWSIASERIRQRTVTRGPPLKHMMLVLWEAMKRGVRA